MMKVWGWLAAAAMMVAPVQVMAQDTATAGDGFQTTVYSEPGGGWTVQRKKSTCVMSASFSTGDFMFVDYDYRRRRVSLAFSEASVKSLKDNDKRKLKVAFNRPTFDDLWGEHEFRVIISGGKTFFDANFGDEMLTDIAKYGTLGFFYNGIVLSSFALDGSSKAIADLKQCATIQSRANPVDIFE